jgi:hypothetical protein
MVHLRFGMNRLVLCAGSGHCRRKFTFVSLYGAKEVVGAPVVDVREHNFISSLMKRQVAMSSIGIIAGGWKSHHE